MVHAQLSPTSQTFPYNCTVPEQAVKTSQYAPVIRNYPTSNFTGPHMISVLFLIFAPRFSAGSIIFAMCSYNLFIKFYKKNAFLVHFFLHLYFLRHTCISLFSIRMKNLCPAIASKACGMETPGQIWSSLNGQTKNIKY